MANTVPAVIPCVTPPEPVEEQPVTLEEAQGAVENIEAKASSVFFASSASRPIKRSTPPQPVSAAEAERRRLAVNADRSAARLTSNRACAPPGGEPFGHAGRSRRVVLLGRLDRQTHVVN